MKVKARDFDPKREAATLERIKNKNITKAKSWYDSFPAATGIWLAMKTKLPLEFIKNNWTAITGEKEYPTLFRKNKKS